MDYSLINFLNFIASNNSKIELDKIEKSKLTTVLDQNMVGLLLYKDLYTIILDYLFIPSIMIPNNDYNGYNFIRYIYQVHEAKIRYNRCFNDIQIISPLADIKKEKPKRYNKKLLYNH